MKSSRSVEKNKLTKDTKNFVRSLSEEKINHTILKDQDIKTAYIPKKLSLVNLKDLKLHQDLIYSIMAFIKPSIFAFYFTKYS